MVASLRLRSAGIRDRKRGNKFSRLNRLFHSKSHGGTVPGTLSYAISPLNKRHNFSGVLIRAIRSSWGGRDDRNTSNDGGNSIISGCREIPPPSRKNSPGPHTPAPSFSRSVSSAAPSRSISPSPFAPTKPLRRTWST